MVIFEAVASQDLWIWHTFLGMAGSHNDINVLQCSPIFARIANGDAPVYNYKINCHPYNKCYYLADGIYPDWSTFVTTIREPAEEKNRRVAKRQKACRKDVERAFGVLQSRWAIIRHPAGTWSTEVMWKVMIACVIMHNMIIEDEHDEGIHDKGWEFQGELVAPHPGAATFEEFLHVHE
jgi:hypothetical protein